MFSELPATMSHDGDFGTHAFFAYPLGGLSLRYFS